ncbi:MAG: flippase-like domain-containing protein [Lachnospiraceae bacterium]|nr:flippase-like domain-containing protein [Lachnospiraceae bacterium]
MGPFLFALAIILIIAGHIVKSLRQKQFSDFYEDVKLPVFYEALAAGYILNLAVPFRLGDILRAVIAGRRMKNGFSFAFATVVVDRILDVIVVGFIFLGLYLAFPGSSGDAGASALFYMLLSLVSITLIAIVTFARRTVKKLIRTFTGIFNEKIELTLMFFFWSMITAFRDMAKRMDKRRLTLLTLIMWGLYTASYYVISLAITMMGGSSSLMDVFSYLFSSSSIDKGNISNGYADKVMIAYLAISAVLLFIIGITAAWISEKHRTETDGSGLQEKTMMLLPQVHESDRRSFLENYFEGNRHAYVRGYLEANSDIQIISDYSAGSNATTLFAIKDDRTIFRKYVVGGDADKLHEQVEWLERYRDSLPLPVILDEKREEGMTLYDMPAVAGATGFFEYIHTNPLEKSAAVIRRVFEDLEKGLYSVSSEKAAPEVTERYIDEKIIKNIARIEGNHRWSELLKYDEVVINGRRVKGFPHLKEAMRKEKLKLIFAGDTVSPIHGDVTVENIIAMPSEDGAYYLIDPNTGNILDSRLIDYSKLLQSLHGGYEFLMRTEDCSISGNEIRFMSGMSRAYRDLYGEYRKYLRERFSEEEIKSIYYHEIADWLRLMPYKMENDEGRAAVFLAGMLLVTDEIM